MNQQNIEITDSVLEGRIVRFADLRPCYNAFIDTRSPGSEAKENFTIIGPGVSENPDQHVHIAEPHGFNIGGARQPPGCVNSQHSHDTAEVFVVHSGSWRFDLGEHGEDAQVVCHPGDTISLPTNMFRGFTAIAPADDGSPGFLWAVLGGDNPGRVLWAPQVFEMARKYGLVLLENGSLVDTVAGEIVPADVLPMPVTTRDQIETLERFTPERAEALVVRADAGPGAIIGAGAPLDWEHGFTLDRVDIGAAPVTMQGAYVLFVHAGEIELTGDSVSTTLRAGDTITVPAELGAHQLSSAGAMTFVVRRSAA